MNQVNKHKIHYLISSNIINFSERNKGMNNPHEGSLGKEVQLILNGHNEQVDKVEDLLTEKLIDFANEVEGKDAEERAGIMNFYYVEICELIRKAAAIGYLINQKG